jgi:hypothetical protein
MARGVRLGRGWWAVVGALGPLLLAGCASEPRDAREQAAQRQIDQADDAGVADAFLEPSRDDVDTAQEIQGTVDELRNAATDWLTTAQERVARAETLLAKHQATAAEVNQALSSAQTALQAQLRAGPMAAGASTAILQARVQALAAQAQVSRDWVNLLQSELQASRLEVSTAQALLAAADRRSQLATSLYGLAGERARALLVEKTATSAQAQALPVVK